MTVVNTVQNMDWRELARRVRDEVGSVSAVITDCPYSERTHSGHDGGTRHDGSVIRDHAPGYGDRKKTKGINYAPWAVADVDALQPRGEGGVVQAHGLEVVQVHGASDKGSHFKAGCPLLAAPRHRSTILLSTVKFLVTSHPRSSLISLYVVDGAR